MKIKLTLKQTEYYDSLFDSKGKVNQNQYNEFSYFGGFGSGKSLIVMLCTYQICLMYPNTPWLYVRETYPELKDSVIPQFNELFQKQGYEYFQSVMDNVYIDAVLELYYNREYRNIDEMRLQAYMDFLGMGINGWHYV